MDWHLIQHKHHVPYTSGFRRAPFHGLWSHLRLLGLMAAAGEWTLMFFWLGVALIVDCIDPTFARRLRVAELLPGRRIVNVRALCFGRCSRLSP
jgi:hypothetical protein